eukprot:CAMPEP_0179468052 /NCGR_PEP_ID=MMETSP0799-20121207/49055_1 /TAXON_ID=46947 /ORGANISM="Geminigera cryophila, Strain CCMP2564" /LENGTH=77 /DNA_ID=CAMNT_0021273823 /DNA_START=6 /DNA_END=235 /DNA_ORIENTATION=+
MADEGKYADMQIIPAKTPLTPRDRGATTAQSTAANAHPPKLMTEERRQSSRPPLLCVDINLGNGQIGRVAIHDGDEG